MTIVPTKTSSREATGHLSVDVVIVTWNQQACLTRCLQSLSHLNRAVETVGQVVVVDNASRTPIPRYQAGGLTTAFIMNRENRGFAPACNQGAARGSAEFILFLNPDTRLHPDALERALSAIDDSSLGPAGLVGLRLIDAQGTTQRTCGRFPTLRSIANQTLGLARLAPRHFRGVRLSEWSHDETRDVDFVCGAALLVRRQLFEELGGFDERFFVYLEDTDLALRARRLGWRTRFCADATVEHTSGWLSGGMRSWRLANSWRSLLVYSWRHLSAARAVGVSIIVLVAPLARVGEALADRSWQIVPDAAGAWLKLGRLLLNDLRHGRSFVRGSDRTKAFPTAAEAE